MSTAYQHSLEGYVIRVADGTKINPAALLRTDSRRPLSGALAEYSAWLAAGNVPDPPDPADRPPVPTEVSAAQGRLALLQADALDAMEDWITTQPRTTQIEYFSRGTWRRDWPLVATGATALGLTEGQVDDLFILAATL